MFSIQMSVTKAGTSYFNLGKKKHVMGTCRLCWVFPSKKSSWEMIFPWSNVEAVFVWRGLRTKSASFLLKKSKAAEKKTEESHGLFGIFLWWDWTCNNSMNSLWVSKLSVSCSNFGNLRYVRNPFPPEAWTKSVPPKWASKRHVYMRSFWQPHHDHQWSTCRCYLKIGGKFRMGLGLVVDKDVVPMNGNMIKYEMKIGPTSWRSVGCPEKL